jgi:hypothetical protein
MTNTQLYLAIGIPIVFNMAFTSLLIGFFWMHMNMRLDAVNERFNAINQRFDDMRDLWRAELKRVEEVLDARLKHLEEK